MNKGRKHEIHVQNDWNYKGKHHETSFAELGQLINQIILLSYISDPRDTVRDMNRCQYCN
jgi:hypothetical protein